MKKRYARILAATLSAAMVFTSAPVNFTGIDLGVIEAKAATNIPWTTGSLGTAVSDAKTVIDTNVDFAANKTVKVAAAEVGARLLEKVRATNDCEHEEFVCTNDQSSNEDIVTAGGTISVTYTVKCTNTNCDSGNASATANITVNVGKQILTEDSEYVRIGSDIECVVGTTTLNDAANGYTVASSDATKVKSAPLGQLNGVKVVKDADIDTYAYDNVSFYKNNGDGTGSLERTVNITIVKKKYNNNGQESGTPADIAYNNVPDVSGSTCTYGGGSVTIATIGSSTTTAWELVNPAVLETATGTVNVRVHSQIHNDPNVDWDAYNYGGISYNASKGWFEKTISITVGAKTIYPAQLKWPTELKAGETLAVGENMADKKLAETESKVYGTFQILADSSDDKAGYGHNTRAIVFTPNDKVTLGTVPTSDSSKYVKHSGNFSTHTCTDCASLGCVFEDSTDPDHYVKLDGITVDASRAVIKVSDVTIKPDATQIDVKALEYGVTPNDIFDNCIIPDKGSDNGTYEIKGIAKTAPLPIGKTTLTITYTLSDSNNNQLDNGKASADMPIEVTVLSPKTKASAVNDTDGTSYQTVAKDVAPQTIEAIVTGYNSNGKDGNALLGDSQTSGLLNDAVDYTYQWYITENGKTSALRGATSYQYTPISTVLGTTTYYCEITAKAKSGATDSEKAVLAKVLEAKYTTKPYTLTVSNVATNINYPIQVDTETAGDEYVVYGYGKDEMSVDVTTADWTITSAKWSYTVDDKKTEIATNEISGSKKSTTIAFPEGLDAGDYVFACEINSKKGADTDVHIVYIPIKVHKAELAADKYDVVEIKKTKITYGTKLSEIQITGPADSEKYGIYQWYNVDQILPAGTYDEGIGNALYSSSNGYAYAYAYFVPNDATKKNYVIVADHDVPSNNQEFNDFNEVSTIKDADVTVEQAKLVIKPATITVDINGKLSETDIKPEVTGLAEGDTLSNLGIKAAFKVTDSVDTSKVGTFEDAITTSVKVLWGGKYVDVTSTNKTTLRDNYSIEVANGSVIVKAATAPTTPSVKPTPAPVKQATAAAPKAAKAKATVKVGKKYTLKLKYAAGKKATVKKVTWKSSKKSVATVSSKGKVTAVKAGKATIAATITFKDGSKKKVKFTVTVK